MDRPLSDPKATCFRIVILILSVFSLLIIAVMELIPMDEETYRLLGIVDLIVCAVFLSDFLWQLYTAESRWRYFYTWGWIDLIASIPSLDAFRWGRTARIVRITRVLRGIRSVRYLLQILGHYRRRSAVFVTGLIVFLSLAIGSISILHFEHGAEGSSIENAEDALWWAWVTITTVGYGDYAPVTRGGRIVAAILMFVGVGLFSSLSGLIASWLLMNPSSDPCDEED